MVTIQKIGKEDNVKTLKIVGLSTDEKPIGLIDEISIANGSCFTEIDTGKKYYYNKDMERWVRHGKKQFKSK